MFTPEERDRVRARVLELARADERITGGARTGSRSVGAEDKWSDIDTAFGLAEGIDREDILRDWTEVLEREFDVVHVFDQPYGPTLYRVYVLSNGLELDIALTPAAQFGPRGPTFELQFGESAKLPEAEPPGIHFLIGYSWIYVLAGRAAAERGKLWQAVNFLNAARDQVFALAAIRFGLQHAYARGVHLLDRGITDPWKETLVRSLERDELLSSLKVAAGLVLREVAEHDAELAERLRAPLTLDSQAA
jgi:hypothetical protein